MNGALSVSDVLPIPDRLYDLPVALAPLVRQLLRIGKLEP